MDTANFATKGDIAEVKELIQKSETSVLTEVKEQIQKSETSVLTEVKELIEKTETSLLTAFYKYAEASERRMFATETVTHTLSDRVAAIETRMREWESKR